MRTIFAKFWYIMLYYCRPAMNVYKKNFAETLKKTVKNRHIIAIIGTT